jgi:ABC-type bacteriocin/lantibiotic exporter with double-glycine peptidase domain
MRTFSLFCLFATIFGFNGFLVKYQHSINFHAPKYYQFSSLMAKKKTVTKFNAPPPPTKAEKQSRADQFDAVTRKFMFTIQGLSKTLPDGSRTILKNINLCFYPGAKIGVVGLNGSGKSTLLKIMAGVEKTFDGVAVPMPGASVGYLPQEPTLEGKTVMDNVNLGVKKSQDLLDRFNELSVKCGETLPDEEMDKVCGN